MTKTQKAARTYTRRLFITLSAYVVLLIGVNLIDASFDVPTPLLICMALLPVLPTIAMLFVIVAFFRDMDEVQQRILNESVIWGTGIVGIACFSYGFLQGAVDLPDISLIWVFPALIGVPGIAMIFVRMRYS